MAIDDAKFEITRLASREELGLYDEAIHDSKSTETDMQRFFEDRPSLLAPLEFSEFVRELRLPKRRLGGQVVPDPRHVRKPDVVGVRIFPLDTPIVVEMKSPNHAILDESSRQLSRAAAEATTQLRSAVLHMFRKEGVHQLRDHGWDITGIIEAEKLDAIDAIALRGEPNDDALIALMHEIQDAGVAIIAMIGLSKAYERYPAVLDTASGLFTKRGISLCTYDELLTWNEILLDFATMNQSLYEYFAKGRVVRRLGRMLYRFPRRSIFRDSAMVKLQNLVYRTTDNVAIYGFGPPPQPAEKGQLKANMPFDVTKVLDPPTFLPGQEHLLWAGRYEGYWIVVKRRLSEPLKREVVWYYFDPPTSVPPVLQ